MFLKKFAVLALALSAGPAAAQDWEFGLSLYAWTPDTRADIATPLGEVSGELSFADAWNALDFAFMGTVSAQKGRLSLLLDSFYFDLSDGRATADRAAVTEVSARSTISVTTAYAAWQVLETPTTRIDLGAGARFYRIDNDVTITTVGGGQSFAIADDWIDPVVMMRYRAEFATDWYGKVLVDAGGFGTGSEFTWQGLATVGYRFSDSLAVEGGYRYISSDRIEANGDVNIEMSGPILGVTWTF